MQCLLCGSGNASEFPAEMIIHFSYPKNLKSPGVWAFPKILVCVDCGFSQFMVPESELRLLAGTTEPTEPPKRLVDADQSATSA